MDDSAVTGVGEETQESPHRHTAMPDTLLTELVDDKPLMLELLPTPSRDPAQQQPSVTTGKHISNTITHKYCLAPPTTTSETEGCFVDHSPRLHDVTITPVCQEDTATVGEDDIKTSPEVDSCTGPSTPVQRATRTKDNTAKKSVTRSTRGRARGTPGRPSCVYSVGGPWAGCYTEVEACEDDKGGGGWEGGNWDN